MTGPEPQNGTLADVRNGTAGVRGGSPAQAAVEDSDGERSSSVRAYAWTGGRTRPGTVLEVETLVSTTQRAEELLDMLRSEHQSVARLCRRSMSVAEIGALLSLPLGVIRVVLDDMAGLGLIEVHHTRTGPDERPNLELLERVRRGLVNLGG
jgi:uncharacterized protein DUF742